MDQHYVRVIGDYGALGDMAFAEVSDRLDAELAHAGIDYQLRLTSVPQFDTYATGFVLAQLAINNKLADRQVFYVNTAPRKDNKAARVNNEGEGLVYARLKNGVRIVAVNSGYSLAFIKPFAAEIKLLNCAREGSQFRSRDVFPQAFGAVMRGDAAIMGADAMAHVPDDIPIERRRLYRRLRQPEMLGRSGDAGGPQGRARDPERQRAGTGGGGRLGHLRRRRRRILLRPRLVRLGHFRRQGDVLRRDRQARRRCQQDLRQTPWRHPDHLARFHARLVARAPQTRFNAPVAGVA